MRKKPLATIITAVKNGADFLESAIESVIAQTYSSIEYIIIDGGSTDGTLDIIDRYRDRIDVLISEPDSGIAQAWNKGIRIAKGEVIATLNHDDFYHKEAVQTVMDSGIIENSLITYGEAHMLDRVSGTIVKVYNGRFNPNTLHNGFGIVHTTCFTPKALYDAVGPFSSRYKIAMDTDFLLRCLKEGYKFEKVNNITYMRNGGLSDEKRRRAFLEYCWQLALFGYPKLKICKALTREFIVNRVRSAVTS